MSANEKLDAVIVARYRSHNLTLFVRPGSNRQSQTAITLKAMMDCLSAYGLGYLLHDLLTGIETYEGGRAKGYLMGVLDMLSGTIPRTVCYSSGISVLKLKMVIFDYLQNNSEQISKSPDKLVYQALTMEWPCK
jgi:Rap1a immunity proteins